MVHILYQTFKFILIISSKKHETVTYNSLIRIYVNQTQNSITFGIKVGYYLELLTTETVRLLGSTKNKLIKDENGKNVSRLEIAEIVLVNCDIVNNDYQEDSRVLYTFVLNKSFLQLLDNSLKRFIFSKTFNSESSSIEDWFTDQSSKLL